LLADIIINIIIIIAQRIGQRGGKSAIAKDLFVRSLVAGSDGVPAFVHPIEYSSFAASKTCMMLQATLRAARGSMLYSRC